MMYIIFLSLNMVLIKADRAARDEMQHYAAFHLDRHCLPKNKMYRFRGFPVYKGLNIDLKCIFYIPLTQWDNYGSEYEKDYLFHPK